MGSTYILPIALLVACLFVFVSASVSVVLGGLLVRRTGRTPLPEALMLISWLSTFVVASFFVAGYVLARSIG